MAHKELITKYAKQLTESNQRIVELEVAVADARAELDTVKSGVVNHQRAAAAEAASANGVLYERPLFQDWELKTAKKRISELEKTVEYRIAEVEEAKKEVQAGKKRAGGQVKDTTGRESGHWEVRNRELYAAWKESEDEVETLKATGNPAQAAQLQKANEKIATMQSKIETFKAQVKAVKDKAKADMKDTKALNQKLGCQKGGMGLKLKSLEKQLANSDRGEKFTALSSEVEELKVKLDRERKRTRDAEAMLGPDGKRCKKCSPVVIDPEGAAAGEEITVAGTAQTTTNTVWQPTSPRALPYSPPTQGYSGSAMNSPGRMYGTPVSDWRSPYYNSNTPSQL